MFAAEGEDAEGREADAAEGEAEGEGGEGGEVNLPWPVRGQSRGSRGIRERPGERTFSIQKGGGSAGRK